MYLMTGSHSDLTLSAVQAPEIKRIMVRGWNNNNNNNKNNNKSYQLHNFKCFIAAFTLGNSFRFQSSNR